MARSSKPKEIVVVGSKVKEVSSLPAGLVLNVGDDVGGTLSWDVDLVPESASRLPGYALSFFDDFEPYSTVDLPSAMLTEDPLGIAIGINSDLPEVGDEVLVSFVASDAVGNSYLVEAHLVDPSGAAFDAAALTTPLDLRLADFSEATLSLSELGSAPFATADIVSLQSNVVPEPATIVLLVTMLGTLATRRWRLGGAGRWMRRLLRRGNQLAQAMKTRRALR